MFIELYIVIFYQDFSNILVAMPLPESNNTYEIGLMLFTDYVFSFEVTAFILLVAIIAAIAINIPDKQKALRQDPGKQVLENKSGRLKIIKDDDL